MSADSPIHMFIDESKARSYLMVAARAPVPLWRELRSDLASLVLPGQRGLHMRAESEARRGQIIDRIARAAPRGLDLRIVDGGRGGPERERRAWCLRVVVDLAVLGGGAHLTLDRDLSLQQFDRQQLLEQVRRHRAKETVTYGHRDRHEDLALAVPDAIAWAWSRDDRWRRRVRPILGGIHRVEHP